MDETLRKSVMHTANPMMSAIQKSNVGHQHILSDAQKVVEDSKGVLEHVYGQQTVIGRNVSNRHQKLAEQNDELRRASIRQRTSQDPQNVEQPSLLRQIIQEFTPRNADQQQVKLEMLSPREKCAHPEGKLGQMNRVSQHPTPMLGLCDRDIRRPTVPTAIPTANGGVGTDELSPIRPSDNHPERDEPPGGNAHTSSLPPHGGLFEAPKDSATTDHPIRRVSADGNCFHAPVVAANATIRPPPKFAHERYRRWRGDVYFRHVIHYFRPGGGGAGGR